MELSHIFPTFFSHIFLTIKMVPEIWVAVVGSKTWGENEGRVRVRVGEGGLPGFRVCDEVDGILLRLQPGGVEVAIPHELRVVDTDDGGLEHHPAGGCDRSETKPPCQAPPQCTDPPLLLLGARRQRSSVCFNFWGVSANSIHMCRDQSLPIVFTCVETSLCQ